LLYHTAPGALLFDPWSANSARLAGHLCLKTAEALLLCIDKHWKTSCLTLQAKQKLRRTGLSIDQTKPCNCRASWLVTFCLIIIRVPSCLMSQIFVSRGLLIRRLKTDTCTRPEATSLSFRPMRKCSLANCTLSMSFYFCSSSCHWILTIATKHPTISN
jgi:hypothetical protein